MKIKYFIVSVILILSFNVYADPAFLEKPEVKDFIDALVKDQQFTKKELNDILSQATYQQKIIDLIQKPYEAKPWDIYKQHFLNNERIQKGIDFWQAHEQSLKKAQDKYKVPAHIIVAILGVETFYGERQGDYKVIDALTTLAFNYPKRSKFFQKELKEFLLLCKEHNQDPLTYKGSYAGAIGWAQFMPSSYRYYADTLSGKGKSDLVHNPEDAIASIGNYISKHGWKFNEEVAMPAQIAGNKYKDINTKHKKAKYEMTELLNKGIRPVNEIKNINALAGLIELNNNFDASNKEFWLTYDNFYVITRYNQSTQYALVVYLLSQQLKTSLNIAKYKTKTAYA